MTTRTALTPPQLRLARAALGLPNIYKTSYRNKHYTRGDGDYHKAWLDLVAKGLAVLSDGIFRLTRAGALLALVDGETVREEDLV
jgi:hypothetical protein